MAESANDKLFRTKVLPIMDKVMADLRHKQVDEMERHASTPAYVMAGAAGPDGGMAMQAASLDSLRHTGKWNSKHTEDYIQMVKDELKRQKITVTPELEKRMIDKMIRDEIPRSTIEYIMKKAAGNSLFYLPRALDRSPLENHISEQAEKRYHPQGWAKGTGWALGATADFLTTGGLGGGWGAAAKFVGVDVALNAGMDTLSNSADDDVPLVIAPEHREEYRKQKAQQTAQPAGKPQTASAGKRTESVQKLQGEQQEETRQEAHDSPTQPQAAEQQAGQEHQTNGNGWTGLLSSFGLHGISDIGNNLGYVLAMLPDVLVGLLTGKTRSLGLKDNLMPIVSIAAGLFVRNPILKMLLVGMGGLNLLNKAGHEAIGNHAVNGQAQGASPIGRVNYRVYADEPLSPRVSQPQIRGNCLIATIDRVPCTIALQDKVVDAYNQGALPLNTLVNAVLAKNDQMRQLAAENYEAQQRAETRTLAQR